ncbi:hypothetical protein QE152_g7974 [Popillia japonica]|uniref:Uncharacterized protein n=1 Tax=Popillia japonica TaxID=7064 RepID=A0AAW1M697_POPJA
MNAGGIPSGPGPLVLFNFSSTASMSSPEKETDESDLSPIPPVLFNFSSTASMSSPEKETDESDLSPIPPLAASPNNRMVSCVVKV